ncbi:MAG: ferritin [Actinobacteria bacterium]|nr:ferritin [Actinomycetota bacterium]
MCAEPYHESPDAIGEEGTDYHRAIVSLIEELEAIDWYQQRIDATNNTELRRILEHNRDEEKEHASMILEWIRRKDDAFSGELKEYLFTKADLLDLEGD